MMLTRALLIRRRMRIAALGLIVVASATAAAQGAETSVLEEAAPATWR